MDKNTIIGLLLIAAVVIVFSIYNRPDQEQLAQQRRIQDSIARVDAQRTALEAEQNRSLDTLEENTPRQDNVQSFFSAATPQGASADTLAAMNVAAEESPSDSLAETSFDAVSKDFVTLENDKIRLQINPKGGAIESVQMKEHKKYDKTDLFLFEGDEARFNLELYNRQSVRLSTEDQVFTPLVAADGKSVTMRLAYSSKQYLDFVYSLSDDDYMMNFDIRLVGMSGGLHSESLSNFKLNWEQKMRQQERGRTFEERFARIHYKYYKQDVVRMSESKKEEKEISEPLKWFAFKDQFFSSVIIADQPFSNAILSSQVLSDPDYIKDYKAEVLVPVTASADGDEFTAGFHYYFGPVHYNTLKGYDKDIKDKADKLELEELVYLGYRWLSWVNKWFVIPVFNFFLSLNWSMGLIILILTLMVKLITSPLTYKSYMSSAKMRVLRPQIQELEKKYPGKDQDVMMKRQQATMQLYNQAGVNPMSGCLPMLIQMPVLLALFFFFPSAIELRQQSFLWADDLSTYDHIISWSGNIPLITRFLGNHISLFCILMTVTNIIYTRFNMAATDTGQQQMPGMKAMPYFMSAFMFFFLNSYPSGLNYYYFLSTLMTIVITLSFRQFINEDKLLARLEANKKKPKKKSGFMARLEEAQKMQEKQARENAKQNAKRNYRR